MKLTLDADVAPNVVQDAFREFSLAVMDERPLSSLELLGWLVIGQNIAQVVTLTATRPLDATPER